MFNRFCLVAHEGLPWEPSPPRIDGYVEPDPGVPSIQLEAGYTHGTRFTYDNGGGSGSPVVAFQAIKDRNDVDLNLGFVTRYDFSFDNNVHIVMVFLPSFGSATGNALTTDYRRID